MTKVGLLVANTLDGQLSSSPPSACERVTSILEDIGQRLPQFDKVAYICQHNDEIKHGLVLFFRNILDLYVTLMNVFSMKSEHSG